MMFTPKRVILLGWIWVALCCLAYFVGGIIFAAAGLIGFATVQLFNHIEKKRKPQALLGVVYPDDTKE